MDTKNLDKIFSRYIRLKNADDCGMVKCITCGEKHKWQYMQCGHYMSRRHMATRFLEMNAHPQCWHCNTVLNGNLKQYEIFLVRTYGQDSIRCLQDLAHSTVKVTRNEIQELTREYKEKLKHINK